MKAESHPVARKTCPRCRRAGDTHCLCAGARTFQSEALFVLLIHPKEARRSVGTARIVKLCLPDTVLIEGIGPWLDESEKLRSLLADPTLDPCLLFPGPGAMALEARPRTPGKRPAILVVDGTWHQARKMIRTSRLLQSLPCVAFSAERESAYGFRRQPARHCLSTVEAVHEVISRMNSSAEDRAHDVLLDVFGQLVKSQVEYTAGAPIPAES